MSDEPSWSSGRPRPNGWTKREGVTRFQNPWISVVEHSAVAPTGIETQYAVLRFHKFAVAALPVHADGTISLVGQHRFPFDQWSWELPEGGVPFSESALEGAKRELREETGLTAAHWREVLNLQFSNSITDEVGTCFLAWDLEQGETEFDETEDLHLVRVPFRELLAEISAGRVRDAMTVATALKAYHMAREGELPDALARAMLGQAPQAEETA